MSDTITFYRNIDGLSYYKFTPSFNNWFYKNWSGYTEDSDKRSIRQWIRMFTEWLRGGYSIYYATQSDRIVGYILVAVGGRRIQCSKKEDIVIGPYYTLKAFRGQGIATKMIDAVLHGLGIEFRDAYLYIKKTNTPSLKAASNCDCRIICEAIIKGLLRNIISVNDGEGQFYILQYGRT